LMERGATLWNLYGPTETTVYASGVEVRGVDKITIGRPLRNTQLYVVDEHMQPVPVGIAGELCIGGAGVARGYLGRPELTSEKFVEDPFAGRAGARMYRTGDLARWLPTGEVDYLGRLDHQVKIRGFRIELGEIESVLSAVSGVREVVVLAREDTPGDKRLVAYVVASSGATLQVPSLRAELGRALPDYMVPSAFVVLDALPMTTSGKVDRNALPAPDFSSGASAYVAPRTSTEERIAAIFCEVLRVERVGVHDDFFALGGHSLLVMKLVGAIRERVSPALPLPVVFQGPTVARLAAAVDSGSGGGDTPLIRLREGDDAVAVVVVGPVGGKLGGYLGLVRTLDPGLVFGLRSFGLARGESAPLETVEAIAARHVADLERAHKGRYVIVGWSFGGVLAFEIARQLVAGGALVEGVVAVDSYPGLGVSGSSRAELLVDFLADHAATNAESPQALVADADEERTWERALRAGVIAQAELGWLRPSFAVYVANRLAGESYSPARAPVAVRWIRATETERGAPSQVAMARESWTAIAGDGLVETTLEAKHYSIMRAPIVVHVAEVVSAMRSAARSDEPRRA
jgi:thioesterase domain-containing protein